MSKAILNRLDRWDNDIAQRVVYNTTGTVRAILKFELNVELTAKELDELRAAIARPALRSLGD